MIVVGIDVGGKNVHVIITKNGTILAKVEASSGIKKEEAVEQAYEEALKQAKLKRQDVARVIVTGSSGKLVTFADGVIPDAVADAKGTIKLVPSARTIINVGAEEVLAIKINAEGKVLDFAVNEKCAAGTGTFIDTIARVLEVTVEEMAKLSLKSTRPIHMNAQCAVFGESEVISLIHQNISRNDIAWAVYEAIAARIGSIARILGLDDDIVIIGKVAKSSGFIESLSKELGARLKVPDDPEYVGALGAAAVANTEILEEKIEVKVTKKEIKG